MKMDGGLESPSALDQAPHDRALQEHLSNLENSPDGATYAKVEDVLCQVRSLEAQQHARSRLCRLARYLEPLLDFLVMYSPAVDMIVQYDVSPSAVVWGSLKTLIKILENSVRYYSFIGRLLAKLADILSISVRYEKMFEKEQRVQVALKELYLEVLLFLQRLRVTISGGSLRLVAKSIFRSVDVEFQNNVQRLSRLNEVFKEEVNLAHRQHIEDHVKEQRLAKAIIERIAAQSEPKPQQKPDDIIQKEIESRRSIAIWLGQIDCSEAFRRATKKRLLNTGLWLFNEPLFQRWLQDSHNTCDDSRTLWIHGVPGAGKTVLSGTIIEHIQNQRFSEKGMDCRVAYFYGDSMDISCRTAFNICVSALSQLLAQLTDIPQVVLDRYRTAVCHGRFKISERDEVFDIFMQVVAALPSCFLVIDALDECSGISDIISWLGDAVRSIPSLHILCLSRDTAAVRKQLRQQPTIRMDAALTKDDVNKYLALAVHTLPCTEPDLRDRVFNTLSRKADGMFLFVELSIQMLRCAINEDDMQSILDTIPNGVNEMYGFILQRLSTEPVTRRSLVQRVFRLVCASVQPMTWSEMRFALSWNADQQRFQKAKEPFKETIYELCCPLIEYQSETDSFRLIHFSLYEYLCETSLQSLSTQSIAQFFVQQNDAQSELALMTLACIAEERVSLSTHVDLGWCPLVAYATKNWCHHVSQSPFRQDLCAKYLEFVACPERRSTWILRWLSSEERSFPLQQIIKLKKLVQDWAAKGIEEQLSMVSILGDIHRALFRLDELQSTRKSCDDMTQARVISNYERLVCIRDLAREYTMAGQIDEGVNLFELALERAESLEGDITPRSCWLLNSLGILYDQQGKTHLAKATQGKALATQEKVLPPDDLDIVLTINELGRIARHLEHFEEAETLHRRALHILEGFCSESDLHITWTKSALGRSLLKQDRPKEAIDLHQQVLAIETSRLGRDHPHTLWTLSDIARCYRAQDKIEDAIATQQEVMERCRDTLGADHPDTLWATNSLGIFYEHSGSPAIARNLHAEALAMQTRRLGENHAHTQWSREVLSRLNDIEHNPSGEASSEEGSKRFQVDEEIEQNDFTISTGEGQDAS